MLLMACFDFFSVIDSICVLNGIDEFGSEGVFVVEVGTFELEVAGVRLRNGIPDPFVGCSTGFCVHLLRHIELEIVLLGFDFGWQSIATPDELEVLCSHLIIEF